MYSDEIKKLGITEEDILGQEIGTKQLTHETAISRIEVINNDVPIRDPSRNSMEDRGPSTLSSMHIKFPTGGATVWTLPGLEGDKPVKELCGVIVQLQRKRAYWPSEQSNGNMRPACSSPDALTGYGEPGGDCLQCPFGKFKSHRNGRSQACKLTLQISMILKGNRLITVDIPPASLTNWEDFIQLVDFDDVLLHAMVTKIGLKSCKNEDQKPFSKAVFDFGGHLSPEESRIAQEIAAKLNALRTAARPALLGTAQADEGEVV
jgi:hypothetical protein